MQLRLHTQGNDPFFSGTEPAEELNAKRPVHQPSTTTEWSEWMPFRRARCKLSRYKAQHMPAEFDISAAGERSLSLSRVFVLLILSNDAEGEVTSCVVLC